MLFTIYTLFPDLIAPYLQEAILARAVREGLVKVELRDLRRFAGNRTGRVDDTPYGGGSGMVIRVDVAGQAVAELAQASPPPDEVILLTPSGERLTQGVVEELAGKEHVALIAGRYEGFDARSERLVTRELSIGDYVLMGGELPALVVIEAVARLVPGVLGDPGSFAEESFVEGLLDYPAYTRPASYEGMDVPEVLLSGHHGEVAKWRRRQALRRTFERRPDLLERAPLTEEERALVSSWLAEGK